MKEKPMPRGAKPAKPTTRARPAARKKPKTRVRDLEKRLAEGTERERATSEILRLISSSPTDLQLVMDTVAERAARLCGASDAQIFRLDGDSFHLAASHGPLPPAQLVPVTRGSVAGRAVIDRQTIHIRDLAALPHSEFPDSLAKGLGRRTVVAVPLVRDGVSIGAILIRRLEVRPFSDRQVRLLETFADQAVIAIENVRLLSELHQKNEALTQAHAQVTEALEQQTATAEILGVISRSPTDVQPVFDTIVRNARTLCGGDSAAVLTYGGEQLHIEALDNPDPERVAALRHAYPMPARRLKDMPPAARF
jgi:two-component system NtrC family sensor kinase